MSPRKAILAGLTGCYLILWVGGVGSHLVSGEAPVKWAWTAPAFLSLAGLIVLLTAGRAERIGLVALALLGFAAELIGLHSGVPFGRYQYTGVLHPQLFGVPLVMAAAWMVLAAYVKTMLTGLRLTVWLEVIIAGLWMTAIDLVVDALAAGRLDYWRWLESGPYYGVPVQNFIGWGVVSWIIFGFLTLIPAKPWRPSLGAATIGLSILLFFTLIALAHEMLLVTGIGFCLCVFHQLIRQRTNRTVESAAPPMTQGSSC